jgi:two-component system CheB/CheR fusion protein
MLIVFEELPEPAKWERQPEGLPPELQNSQIAAELEEELMRVRQDYRSAMEELQTSNEELRSSNEELHSSNEELQSTNEELESSREELQSLNEELNTVNSELNSKMGDLRDAYRAINSVLNNTRIAIVFLDTDLRLRRFTPEATQLLNVIESDVGRPLEHITHNMEYEDLSTKARQVLQTLTPFDEEIKSKDGAWYHVRIMLYRPEEHTIEGVVLTFIDIEAQKESQRRMKEMKARSDRFAESVMDMVRESLLVLDGHLRVVRANRSFYDTFRTNQEETEGKRVFELCGRRWDIAALRKLLGEVVDRDKSFEDYLVEHRFSDIGLKRMLLNARRLHDNDGNEDRIVLVMADVTRAPGEGRE